MTNITDIREMKARIIVFGVGGAGGNAVNNMIVSGLQGVDFIVAIPTHRRSACRGPSASFSWVLR